MRILYLSDNYPPERTSPRISEQAIRWAAAGEDVTVLTSVPNFPLGKVFPGYKNKWRQKELKDGVTVLRVKTLIFPNKGFFFRIFDFLSFTLSAFFFGLFEKKTDVIIGSSPHFFVVLGAWALAFVRRVPFVFELRDIWPASVVGVGVMRPSLIIRMMEKVELFLYRRAKVVIAVTEAYRDNLISRGIPADKIKVVTNGVDLNHFFPGEKDSSLLEKLKLQGKFVVGYIGTHGLAQGLEQVLEGALLLKDHPVIRFLFVGEGAARKKLMEFAQKNQLNNVVFLDEQPREEIPNYLSNLDIMLVSLKNAPVFTTVLPGKLFEGMAKGLPMVIIAPEGEATEFVRKNGLGVSLPPENPEKLKTCLLSLLESPEKLRAFSLQGIKEAPRFDRNHLALDALKVLRDVISPV